MKKIRILSPEWTEKNPIYTDEMIDEETVIEDLEVASMLPIPFESEMELSNGTRIDAGTVMKSLLADWGVLKDGMTNEEMYGMVLRHKK